MNRIMLLGRLAKDPEIRYTPSDACVAQFTLAVDRPYTKDGQKEADFITCVAWGKTAEAIGNYVHKGQRLLVEGRLQIRSYDAQDGSKRWVTEVIVSHGEFIERKEQQPATPQPAQQGGYYSGGAQQPAGGFDGMGQVFEEEIPF